MTDKVKLIREEIERRIKEGSSKNDISEGALALDSLLDFIDSLPEEPASEDLEEAAEKYAYNEYPSIGIPNTVIELSFKAGAEWGMNHKFRPISEDLEKEYDNYFKKHETDIVLNPYSNCKDIAHHFVEWQRKKDVEEMMKTLVKGEIVKDIHNQLKFTSEPLNDTFGKFGDKLKIIIVKED